MRPFLRSIVLVLLPCVAAACGEVGTAADAGAVDAPAADAAAGHDAGGDSASATDAFVPDGGSREDLGVPDLGALDATLPDDAGGGVTCGTAICGDGMRCCSASCSLCGPLGATCPAIACYDAGTPPDAAADGAPGIPACRPMEASGTGTCGHLLGYAFDGTVCRAIRGCSCTGPDCSGLYTSLATCAASVAPCSATP